MGGIFLSGGSGCGKTTFCKDIVNKYPDVELVIDVIRDIHKKHPYISYLPTNERQLVYTTEYIKVHQRTEFSNFISDRSLLNVLAFWKMNPKVVSYLNLEKNNTDLIILIPVPSFKWYEEHVDYFYDPIRINTYKQRAGIKEDSLIKAEVSKLFYEQDLDMYNSMKIMCENLGWNFYIPSINEDDFQSSWQQQSYVEIISTWFNPRIRKMIPKIVSNEEYDKVIKRVMGEYEWQEE